MKSELRLMEVKDLPAIYDIYCYYVENSTAIFDIKPESYDQLSNKLIEISKTNSFYVALVDDELIGYGYVHPAFSKEAYKYCVELTIYFKDTKHYGLPSMMLDQIEEDCRQKKMRWIISCITDSNVASIKFHEKHGYKTYGALPTCGLKKEEWLGVIWMCKDFYHDETNFIAKNATVLGNVKLGKDTSIWYEAVVRADNSMIEIGDECNIQDQCVLHVDKDHPIKIGNLVTIGHQAIIHGATIEDEVMVGMGAIIMNDVHIEKHCIIGAGALLTEGMQIPENSVVVGCPAKIIKQVNKDQIDKIIKNAKHYVNSAKKQLV